LPGLGSKIRFDESNAEKIYCQIVKANTSRPHPQLEKSRPKNQLTKKSPHFIGVRCQVKMLGGPRPSPHRFILNSFVKPRNRKLGCAAAVCGGLRRSARRVRSAVVAAAWLAAVVGLVAAWLQALGALRLRG
jgi:hypothetical protein